MSNCGHVWLAAAPPIATQSGASAREASTTMAGDMQELWLANNNYTGALPGSWALPKSLWRLDLSMNRLEGPIAALANWTLPTGRIDLFLQGNELTGVHQWASLCNTGTSCGLPLPHPTPHPPSPPGWAALAHRQWPCVPCLLVCVHACMLPCLHVRSTSSRRPGPANLMPALF